MKGDILFLYALGDWAASREDGRLFCISALNMNLFSSGKTRNKIAKDTK